MRWPFLAFALVLSGCSQLPGRPLIDTLETRNWRQAATAADRDRIGDWRETFVAALADARANGHGDDIDALGALGQPDAALPYAPPAPGDYRCRVIKVGARSAGMLSYVDYPYFNCRIRTEQDLLGFAKLTGSQRPVGLIFPDGQLRAVFLGTLVLGDEQRAMRYSADPDRDVAGVLQTIEGGRYRLLLPEPRFESMLDIIELVPAT
ncbi:DUF4893 domain-containing protein [Sphingomicrobium clamense]|uniref:DUF4893 domain-containing protein n=1 Tax=Sphingomicrobium clamense TaxID=2851013 RepID=A0ABS6V7R2_9SPHN|nr:DUF4893 domain-containing protein [Sphingomicrobium sp. B8]MBW0145620.1 DUF4893 domain-containing protein [Sphingomicrobium sp. B8]